MSDPVPLMENAASNPMCSRCLGKISFVRSPETGYLVGLTCENCNIFWPLILSRFECDD